MKLIQNAAASVTGEPAESARLPATALADAGARVFTLDLEPALERARLHPGVTGLVADITDRAEVDTAVAAAAQAGPLRVVVNCTGAAPVSRVFDREGRSDLALYSRVLQVNLAGTCYVLARAAQAMSQSEPPEDGQRGAIVNTASIAAYDGQNGQIAFASSRGGVVAMTLSAARELAAHGIRVNAIAPGIIDTRDGRLLR